MPDYVPKFKPGHDLTRLLTGTVTGGQIITVAGVTAGASAADFLGVASRDGVTGDRITVHCNGVQRVTASGAIAIGARVKTAAAGAVQTYTAGTDPADSLVGIALEAAVDGALLDVKFFR